MNNVALNERGGIQNHQINPVTGFMENPGFIDAFDSDKKVSFLKLYRDNGLKIWNTCRSMGISVDTVNRHYRNDPVFKKAFDEVETEYLDELEGVSRINALNPKAIIERIFQLKALKPEKYGDKKNSGEITIQVKIDENVLENLNKRQELLRNVIDAEIVDSQQAESAKNKDIGT